MTGEERFSHQFLPCRFSGIGTGSTLLTLRIIGNITTFNKLKWSGMDKTISAAEANRNFSKLLRDVREGQSYVVTSHGRPVAKITPAGSGSDVEERSRAALLARLRAETAVDVGRWTREDLYEDAV